MSELKTYGDIYDKEFLEKFGGYRDDIEQTDLDNKYSVNVEKIANLCEIKLIFEELDVSGSCMNFHSLANDESNEYSTNEETREIRINKYEPLVRQRFTIAHEIGHILLGHEGISYRDPNYQKYNDLIMRAKEANANSFAAELLMPEILLRDVIYNSIKNLGFDSKSMFSDADIDYLAYYAANDMGVSITALKYRLMNLKIFR